MATPIEVLKGTYRWNNTLTRIPIDEPMGLDFESTVVDGETTTTFTFNRLQNSGNYIQFYVTKVNNNTEDSRVDTFINVYNLSTNVWEWELQDFTVIYPMTYDETLGTWFNNNTTAISVEPEPEEPDTPTESATIKKGTYRWIDNPTLDVFDIDIDICFEGYDLAEIPEDFSEPAKVEHSYTLIHVDRSQIQYQSSSAYDTIYGVDYGGYDFMYTVLKDEFDAGGITPPEWIENLKNYGRTFTVINDTEVENDEYATWFNANTEPVSSGGETPDTPDTPDADVTVDSIKAKIQNLINKANTTTGKSDTDLTSGVDSLIAGYGQGGDTPVKMKDVNFYDYDGTLLHSYTVAEAQALTEMPPLPTQKGLICQGWNRTLEQLKQYDRKVDVGATYITDDGTTRIYFSLSEGRTSPMLGVCPNGTVTVDWGDGTTPDVLTGFSTASVKWTPTHNYASAGDYVIKLTVSGQMGFGGQGLLAYSSATDNRNYIYLCSIKRIEIGNSVTSIGSNAFRNCYSLTNVTIPNSVTNIGLNAFYFCYALTSVNIPNSVTSIGSSIFNSCYSLTSVTIPNSVTNIGTEAFKNCHTLTSVNIPNSVTSIGSSAFNTCDTLTNVTIPNSITSIGSSAFYFCFLLASVTIPNSVTDIASSAFKYCYGVKYYDFTSHTSVPTLANSDAFTGITSDCEIRVPAALYDEWIAATNWSTLASQIVVG